MTSSKPVTATFKFATLLGAITVIAASASQAALLLPGTAEGGLSVPVVAPSGGTVLKEASSSFTDTFGATGTLRTIVVQTAGVGSPLDFYYQVVNTTPTAAVSPGGDEQIYRVAIQNGFPLLTTTNVDQTSTLTLAGLTGTYATGASLKPALTADRDFGAGQIGSVGFDFPTQAAIPFSSGANIAFLQNSDFLVVHTNATTFASVTGNVLTNGAGQNLVSTFAPIPEPSSILFGLGMFGVALTNRSKRRASK